jgi:hypothetical protein
MSAGAFETGIYEDGKGGFRGIRVQPETKALTIATVANAYAAGPVDTAPRAKVSGSRRSYGVHARKVTVRFTGTVPTGYKALGTTTLPWFDPTTFAALTELATGTYLGSPIELVGTSAEKIK